MGEHNIILLRVAACMGVFTVHLGQLLALKGSVRVVTDFGASGVYLFFIISGFLAYDSYGRCSGLKEYYCKRAVKILPAYYVVVLYYFLTDTFIFHRVTTDTMGLGWIRHLLFLNGILKADSYWFNLGATWTIPVFVLFYLLVPLLYKILNSYLRACIGFASSLVLFMAVSVYGGGYFSAVQFLHYFIIGIVIYYALKENKENQMITWLILCTMFFMLQSSAMSMLVLFLFSILIISTRNMKISNKLLDRLLILIDRYSYTVYLVQSIVFGWVSGIGMTSKLGIAITSICGTAILAALVYHLIEMPIRKTAKNMCTKFKIMVL